MAIDASALVTPAPPSTSVQDDALMVARWATLGAAAGGLGGFIVGGIGGRIAMFVLRLTSPDYIRGAESDDGFEMGRFDISSTGQLLLVTTILGILGGLIVVAGRPFFPRKYAPFGWALAAGAIVGATIVHDDGVDFTLIEPVGLAVAMFIGIPAIGAYTIAEFVYRAEPWWWKDRKRTLALGAFGLPIFIGFPIAIAATLISAAWLAALRIPGVHDLGRARSIRVLALAVFAVLTGMGLFALANDLSNVL
jgi:hypothetical protein